MSKPIHPYEVLRRPIVTEKSTTLAESGKYVFEVALAANKPQIKVAVEQAFDVTVLRVNTHIVKGKRKRLGQRLGETATWKKAVVTLQPGDHIEVFEGV